MLYCMGYQEAAEADIVDCRFSPCSEWFGTRATTTTTPGCEEVKQAQ